jgi:hypothetical protein
MKNILGEIPASRNGNIKALSKIAQLDLLPGKTAVSKCSCASGCLLAGRI